jgi:DNA-binding HxlR family transcriptional regulator
MEAVKKRSDCPLGLSLDVFGDKWSLLIIRDMIFGNKYTYNDFLKSEEGIATNILAARLKAFEENGVIEKTTHPDSKAKILYRLTAKGIDLLPVIMEIYFWSEKYYDFPSDIKAIVKEAKKDKEKFARQVIKELKSKMAGK